jgi:hypothetical protein
LCEVHKRFPDRALDGEYFFKLLFHPGSKLLKDRNRFCLPYYLPFVKAQVVVLAVLLY